MFLDSFALSYVDTGRSGRHNFTKYGCNYNCDILKPAFTFNTEHCRARLYKRDNFIVNGYKV